MARVFVSYRRADGRYAVGWLAEQLRSLDAVNGVQTAFHDAALRAGEDFEQALEREVDDADVVVAVIGPNWLGERPDGPARITETDDWVVREIAMALEKEDTLVVPVRIDGADHPLASQVHPSIAELARLHSLPFSNGVELQEVVDEIAGHLAELDLRRAMEADLAKQVEVPKLARPARLTTATIVAAVVGGVAGFLAATTKICPLDADTCAFTEVPAAAWFRVLVTSCGAFLAGAFVVGRVLVRRLRRIARFRWRQLNAMAIVVAVITMLAIVSFEGGQLSSPEPPISDPARNWVALVLGVVLVLPWPVAMNAPAMSDPIAPRAALAERARYLGTAQDAERWGAIMLSVIVTFGIAIMTAMTRATDEAAARLGSDLADVYQPALLVTFAAIISAMLIGLHMWNLARLAELRVALDADLAGLPLRYRKNAEPLMVASSLNEGGLAFRAFLALPAVAALVIVVTVAIVD